ncbi:hypothetical protein RIF29_00395 [Crotalaria pallida]|uniref:Uncharacterized protein n=1 Tax=Crotalaria pallida TaxID=3830 RepID=A0AAN9P6I0_CROPI
MDIMLLIFHLFPLIAKNIEELKQSVEEKASAVKRAEEGAADLKKRVDELSKSLEDHEGATDLKKRVDELLKTELLCFDVKAKVEIGIKKRKGKLIFYRQAFLILYSLIL